MHVDEVRRLKVGLRPRLLYEGVGADSRHFSLPAERSLSTSKTQKVPTSTALLLPVKCCAGLELPFDRVDLLLG